MSRRRLLGLLAAASVAACAPGRGTPGWLPGDAPHVRCVVAGPHRIQPIFAEVPAPPLPTGLYARGMDPMALASLGYTRDHVVCAAVYPTPADTGDDPEAVEALAAAHDEASRRVAAGPQGACACDAARRLGVDALVAGCERRPVAPRCADDEASLAALRAFEADLSRRVAGVTIPWVHVRMAGRTDRPGWFARHATKLLARHPGPSDVFLPGQALGDDLALAFVRNALAAEGVVAVVRQDLGRAFLVVRELDGVLLLDHFAYPTLPARRRGLVRLWERENPQVLARALGRPAEGLVYDHDPRTASVFVVDVPRLAALDRHVAVAYGLEGRASAARAVVDDRPDPLSDRVVVLAPFGRDGNELRARMTLSEAGRVWAQTLPEGPASPTLTELGMPPVLVRPPEGVSLLFTGTCAEAWYAHGPKLAGPRLAALERGAPGAVGGTFDEVRIEVPAPPASWQPCDEPTRRLLARLSARPHRLEASFDPPRAHLDVVLRPAE